MAPAAVGLPRSCARITQTGARRLLSANQGVFFAKANSNMVSCAWRGPGKFRVEASGYDRTVALCRLGSGKWECLTCDDIPAARDLRPHLSRQRYDR